MKTGRNEPCPCGSQNKFKRCCMNKPYQPSAELEADLALGQQRIAEYNAQQLLDRTARNAGYSPFESSKGYHESFA
jgi:hypothetical protein